jgi:predicted Zn-dependent protease
MRGERRILGSFLACAVALAGACSSSPKSDGKKQRTILSTEYDDSRVGQQASEDVAAQIGVLEDAPVNAYVNEIGRKLLRGMPRRSFHYQFAVVDQVEPNAFALPGGYIFISRGLLELANDEDELANVIGHEITHSARRHAAAQQEASKRGNPLNPYMRASSQAAYGRDMERTADKGGQMLAAAAGYDPLGMSRFLKSLGQMERFQLGYTRGPSMFATHPGTDERSAATAARAQEIRWKRDPGLGDTRVRYLKRIEGLPVGQRPEAGIFEGERFVHPDLDFQVMFPRGWQTSNTNMRVGAMSPRGDALVYLSADLPSGDPRTVAETFLEKTDELQGIQIRKSQPVKVGGLDAWRMQVEAGSRGVPGQQVRGHLPAHGPELPSPPRSGARLVPGHPPGCRYRPARRGPRSAGRAHGKPLGRAAHGGQQRHLRESPLRGRRAREDLEGTGLHAPFVEAPCRSSPKPEARRPLSAENYGL